MDRMEIYVLDRMEILLLVWVCGEEWKFLYMGKFGRRKATEARKSEIWV